MKKISILLAVCCLAPVSGFAQLTFYETYYEAPAISHTMNTLVRKVKNAFTDSNPLSPWAKQVKSEQRIINGAAGPFQTSFYALITTSYTNKFVKGEDSNVYHKRLPALNQALHQNKVIGSFSRLIVPDPHELAQLYIYEFNDVKDFLQHSGYEKESTNVITPKAVSLAESGVVQVTLDKDGWDHTVFLRIDCRRNEVYLFSALKRQMDRTAPFPSSKHPLR